MEFSVKKLSIANLYLNGDYTAKFTNEMKIENIEIQNIKKWKFDIEIS